MKLHMSRLMTKPTKWHVRTAKTQISLSILTKAFFMRTAKTLIRLGGRPGWSESLLGAHAILFVLSWGGSRVSVVYCHCSPAFCSSSTSCTMLRLVWWPPVQKMLSPWLSRCAVLNCLYSFPVWCLGQDVEFDCTGSFHPFYCAKNENTNNKVYLWRNV